MKIRLDRGAVRDLRDIRDRIEEDNPRAADRVISRIRQTILMLGQFPKVGRAGVVSETREFPVVGLPYIVVFTLPAPDELVVIAVVHSRMQRP